MLKSRKLSCFMIAVFFLTIFAGFGGVSRAEAAVNLSDIQGHWAQGAIQDLVNAGAVLGTPAGTFQPDKNVTRAEFATMIVKAFNLESQTGKTFNDTANHWAKDAIAIANGHGIVVGYNGDFRPDAFITNQEMAVMVVKAAKLAPATAELTFNDADQISDWAKNDVVTAFANKLIVGYNGYFNPQNHSTKAQAAVVIRGAMLLAGIPIDGVVAVTGVKLNKTSITLTVGSTELLVATVEPANATNKDVTWSSSDSYTVKVDANGKVTGLATGSAIITATTADGQKTADCKVTVTSSGGGGGGGGGGTADTPVTAINVELTGLGAAQTVAANGVTFDLSAFADNAAASQVRITTTPNAAITNATLTISNITTRGINFLSAPITTNTPDGIITVGQLLGGLAADNDVSLGALRTILGSQDITVTGKLSKSGYIFNSGQDINITIRLGAGGSAVINNAYANIEKTGAKTARVTIKDQNATVGALRDRDLILLMSLSVW